MPDVASQFASFGRCVEEHLRHLLPGMEEEARKAIDYVNDEVVPQVRCHSSHALRLAAEHIDRLAQHLDLQKEVAKRTDKANA